MSSDYIKNRLAEIGSSNNQRHKPFKAALVTVARLDYWEGTNNVSGMFLDSNTGVYYNFNDLPYTGLIPILSAGAVSRQPLALFYYPKGDVETNNMQPISIFGIEFGPLAS